MPPYELQTNYVEWRVEGPAGVLGTCDDEHDVMTKAVEALVGHRVLEWEHDATSQALVLVLESGLSMHIEPYFEEESPHGGAWWFVSRDDDVWVGVDSDLTTSSGTYSESAGDP